MIWTGSLPRASSRSLKVIGVHIDERFIKDGLLDTAEMKPIMRAGYQDYFVATETVRFAMPISKAGRKKRTPRVIQE